MHKIQNLLFNCIHEPVQFYNLDNISRTNAYFSYYKRHPEIEWAFLASMVSRNAGYNMTDLEGSWFPFIIKKTFREQLFYTYERANWLIFKDAFPQLMLYELSKRSKRPLFHLLPLFSVSSFMEKEWMHFWNEGDRKRLMYALIINEQNLIQKPVIEHPFYKKKVFRSLSFRLQDWLHFSTVLFPTKTGELYGICVQDFCNIDERIALGKKLASLLFHPEYYSMFYEFANTVAHTGTRRDYERNFQKYTPADTLPLRLLYPVVHHHEQNHERRKVCEKKVEKWLRPSRIPKNVYLTEWFLRKQEFLHIMITLEHYMKKPSVHK